MNGRIGGHGVQEGDVIYTGSEIWKEVGHILSTLPVLLKFPLWPYDSAFILFSTTPESLHVNSFPIERVKVRLVVKSVHVARPTVHEEEYDVLGLAVEMAHFWG